MRRVRHSPQMHTATAVPFPAAMVHWFEIPVEVRRYIVELGTPMLSGPLAALADAREMTWWRRRVAV